MKTWLLYILIFCSFLMAAGNAFGAAATLTYATPNVLAYGTAITITPTVAHAGSTPTYTITSGTLPPGLTMSASTGVITGPNTTAIASTVTITVLLTPGGGGAGTGTPSSTFTIQITARPNNWTGASGTWATTTNWSAGVVPTVNDSVSIGVVTFTTAPTISTAGQVARSITFGSVKAGVLTITSPGTLAVSNATAINAGATATVSGTGTMSTNSLTFTGASSLTLTTLTATVSHDFTVNTGATATITGTGNVNISPLASLNVVTTGVLTTTMTGKLTLKSDATGSAYVGQILSTSITGSGADSIHVERFMTGGTSPTTHRGYYLFSSPVHVVPLANSNKVYDLHYLQYAGMYLTGSGGTANGFDRGGGPTIYLFREDQAPNNSAFSAGNFPGISKINNTNKYDYNLNGGSTIYNIPVGNGMMVFFRGNRTGGTAQQETYTTFVAAPTVTLTAAGTLNAGQIVFHDWYKPSSANLGWSNTTANSAVRGFNLVGNPYASSIDWDTYTNTNNGTGIYASANVSNFVYEFNMLNHNYDTYQKGTGGNGAKTGNATHIIVSGQGFYVLAAVDSTEQLIFNESAKVTAQNTGVNLYMSTRASMSILAAAAPEPHLSLKLLKDSINTDNTYIGFTSAASTKYVFNEDAPYKRGNGLVSLSSLSSDNLALTINKLPFPRLKGDTIPISVGVNATGTYTFNMAEASSMPAIYEVWLMDAFTKDSLDMRQNSVYTFNVDLNNGATFGTGRFKVIIRENPALAIHLLSFTGTKAITGAQINWTTENEQSYTNFTVERSTDKGVTFTALGGFASSSQGTYGFLDTNPLLGVDMYRLKIADLNGTVTYSNVVSLTYTQPAAPAYNPIRVYPNPVKNTLNLIVSPENLASGSTFSNGMISPPVKEEKTDNIDEYSITIVNNSGAVLKKAVSNKATWQADVSNFMPGSYVIQVVSKSGKATTGQCVFIKL